MDLTSTVAVVKFDRNSEAKSLEEALRLMGGNRRSECFGESGCCQSGGALDQVCTVTILQETVGI